MMISYFVLYDSTIIIILSIVIIALLGLSLTKIFKNNKLKLKNKNKKATYKCLIISKRQYINSNREKFYYVKFLINEEEKEYLVPKNKFDLMKENMYGELTLLLDRVFLDFVNL